MPAAPVKLHELSTDVANAGSKPTGFATVGGKAVFFSSDGTLYASDGTAAGTTLLRDLGRTLSATDTPPRLTVLGAAAYWYKDGELWRTDGTVDGTARVFAIAGDAQPDDAQDAIAFNGALYFGSVYRSDGTTAGTAQLAAVPSRARWQPAGGLLYFLCASTFEVGFEPCVTDGTVAGTHVLKDILPGEGSSEPHFLGAIGTRAVFSATKDPVHGARGLWATDGTTAGTVELIAPPAGGTQSAIADDALPAAILGGNAYLPCFTTATGTELCKTNGTVAGTSVLDVVPGADSLAPVSPVTLAGRVVFAGTTAAGAELWSTDGTTAGTAQLVDVLPGAGSGVTGGRLVVVGTTAYFAGHSVANTPGDLWKTDGTAGGTVRVAATQRIGLPQKTPLALGETGVLGGQLVFTADDGVTGLEPWITDGTTAGTHLIKDLIATRTQAQVHGFAAYHGATYVGTASTTANRLWQTDGTTDGTTSLVQAVVPSQLTQAGYALFFFDEAASMLWKTDGTPDGTQQLAATPQLSRPRGLGNQLVFAAQTTDDTNNVWLSDGTPDGTHVSDPAIYDPAAISVANGRVWVQGSPTTTFDGRLFVSGRDAGGALQLAPLCPDCTPNTSSFAAAGNVVVFAGFDAVHSGELWKSDATAAGTALLADLAPGTDFSAPSSFFAWPDKQLALFEATTNARGLWRTDGTAAGTAQLAQVNLAFPATYLAWGDHVFFVATDAQGTELWRTDGTPAGTVIVADLSPGPVSSNPGLLTLVGPTGPLVFAADTPSTGRELWQLTAPEAAPQLLADLAPGPRSSRPTAVTVQGTALIVAADAGDGYALWKLDGVGSDSTPPALTCPDDQTQIGDQPGVVTYPAPAGTDASGAPSITADRASGSVFPAGETIVHVVATDRANNASACTFTVRIEPDVVTDAGGADGALNGNPGGGGGDHDGGCRTTGAPAGLFVLAIAVVVLIRRRRRR